MARTIEYITRTVETTTITLIGTNTKSLCQETMKVKIKGHYDNPDHAFKAFVKSNGNSRQVKGTNFVASFATELDLRKSLFRMRVEEFLENAEEIPCTEPWMDEVPNGFPADAMNAPEGGEQ